MLQRRCAWARTPLGIAYHDAEWGVPVHDDRLLFEFLILEGAQAGLSWETILKKRDAYREAFGNFDPAAVARYRAARIERLLQNPGIVRNRLKVESTVSNAKALLAIQKEFGSFDAYLWRFVGGKPRVNRWRTPGQVPA
ncbi:MAG TPA: DNA-3-methyladenine glycosylase I, partial [Burkholderiales bacterium]|nr:DNA-3-methyladenine glycosylase I [Burkholderiales bacterium]